MPFHDQQAQSASFNKSRKGQQLGKEPKRSFDGQIIFCHIVMTLKKVFLANKSVCFVDTFRCRLVMFFGDGSAGFA
jgi:hypothetical protein